MHMCVCTRVCVCVSPYNYSMVVFTNFTMNRTLFKNVLCIQTVMCSSTYVCEWNAL